MKRKYGFKAMLNKLGALVLSVLLFLGTIPAIAFADEVAQVPEEPEVMEEGEQLDDPEVVEEEPGQPPEEVLEAQVEEEVSIPTEELAEPEELLDDYVTVMTAKVARSYDAVSAPAMNRVIVSNQRGSKLTGAEKKAYDCLKSEIQGIAAGSTDSTVITLSFDQIFTDVQLSARFTAEDLEMREEDLIEWNPSEERYIITDEAASATTDQYVLNLDAVVNALLYDCPYALFWFDKTVGVNSTTLTTVSGEYNIGGELTLFCTGESEMVFYFAVSDDYSPLQYYVHNFNGTQKSIQTDTGKIQSIDTAINNAAGIVTAAASEDKSDYETLEYYKDTICSRVIYDEAAAKESNNTPYGDPWQLISVFDNDPNTNVVCEGYSKAFKYLCDLTEFDDAGIDCFIVTGEMAGGTGAGGHMWNLVTIDGENYLVDVTNCDDGTVGASDKLFLVGNETGNAVSYTFSNLSPSVRYTYDAETISFYSDSERILAKSNYSPAPPSFDDGLQEVVEGLNSLNLQGTEVLVRFTPKENGKYRFESVYDYDCEANLYKGEEASDFLAYAANEHDGNFKLEYDLEADVTYYLQIIIITDAVGEDHSLQLNISNISYPENNEGNIEIQPTELSIKKGATGQFEVSLPADLQGSTVYWSVDDPNIATMISSSGKNGRFEGRNAGQTTVRASLSKSEMNALSQAITAANDEYESALLVESSKQALEQAAKDDADAKAAIYTQALESEQAAESAYNTSLSAKQNAATDLQNAYDAKTAADTAVVEATSTVTIAESNVTTKQGELTAAQTVAQSAQTALTTAQNNLATYQEEMAAKLNSYEFFKWLAVNTTQSQVVRNSAALASRLLENALTEEDESFIINDGGYKNGLGMGNPNKTYSEIIGNTDIGAEGDSTNWDNFKHALYQIGKGNEYRALENLPALEVSSTLMAVAEVNANYQRSLGSISHSKALFAGENLAMSSDGAYAYQSVAPYPPPYSYDPYTGWYTQEKLVYDYIRDRGWVYKDLTSEQKNQIKNDLGFDSLSDVQEGHYLTLTDKQRPFETTGFGYVYKQYIGGSFSKTDQKYAQSFNYQSGNDGLALDVYNSLVQEYEDALTAQETALASIVDEKQTALTTANDAVTAAQTALNNANQTLANANIALQTAQDNQTAAANDITIKQAVLSEKEADLQTKLAAYQAAENVTANALVDKNAADDNYQAAQNATAAASGVVASKLALLEAAQNNFDRSQASATLIVLPVVEDVKVDKPSVILNVGDTQKVTATVYPDDVDNKNVTWASSNETVATVDNGNIVGIKGGTAIVTVTTEESGKTATVEVTVLQPVTSVSLNKTSLKLEEEKTETLSVTVNPADANNKNVTWTSSDSNVVTVDSNGKVTAKKPGTATITVKTNNGLTATCKVTVTSKDGEITKVAVPSAKTGLVYNGKSQVGVPSGTNYSIVSGGSGTNAGTYTAKVKLPNTTKYAWTDGTTGEKAITWKIAPASIANASVSGISSKTFTGKAITQTPTIKIGATTLKAGTDYTVSHKNNVNVGTATITITAKGNYKDGIIINYKINPASIAKATVSGITDKTYNGKAQTQSPTVKLGTTTLRSGADYSLSYSNNLEAGIATVTIAGKGNYGGSIKRNFTIGKMIVTNQDTVYRTKYGEKYHLDGCQHLSKSKIATTAIDAKESGLTPCSVCMKPKNVTVNVKRLKASWKRLWGNVALDTMAAITKEFGKSEVAIVTTNGDFKDALSAAALAGRYSAPVLMTSPKKLSGQTKSELKRMGVKTVYVLGSTADVSNNVVSQIKAAGVKTVKRIDGKTPSARAIAASNEIGKAQRSDTVIIATQANFLDALSVSPFAYASKSPIIYIESSKKLSDAAVKHIKGGGFKYALIVGGPAAIPAGVETQLKNAGIKSGNITRLAGEKAYQTSLIIAEWATGKLKNGTGAKTGKLYKYASIKFQPTVMMEPTYVGIATSGGWHDALAGAALCGKHKGVLLLADDTNSSNTSFTKANKGKILQGYVFGGTAAISNQVYKACENSTK